MCGIVLQINGLNYYALISHYSKQQKDNILIKNRIAEVKGSIRFNYMFPVPDFCLNYKDFSKEEDINYRKLLFAEYAFCIRNEQKIKNKAHRTYTKVIDKLSESLLHNSCDFKLLEKACLEYQQLKDIVDEFARAENLQAEEQIASTGEKPDRNTEKE